MKNQGKGFRAGFVAAVAVIGLSLTIVAPAATITSFTYTLNASGYTPAVYSGAYPDGSGTELNDDYIPITYYGDPGWVGTLNNPAKSGNQAQPEVDLVFDQFYNFSGLTVTYLRDYTDLVPSIGSVDLSFSSDGVTFSTPQTYTGFNTNPVGASTESLALNLSGKSGQYVRADFFNGGGSYAWLFLGELDFTGTVPEPSSVIILGIGGLLLARRRSRA